MPKYISKNLVLKIETVLRTVKAKDSVQNKILNDLPINKYYYFRKFPAFQWGVQSHNFLFSE